MIAPLSDFPIARHVTATASAALAALALAVLPPAAHAQTLILNADNTIEVAEGDVDFYDEIESYKKNRYKLTIEGLGQVHLRDTSLKFYGEILIRAAEFHIEDKGKFGDHLEKVTVTHGGAFVLDNTRTNEVNQIRNKTDITLHGGTLRFLERTGPPSGLENFGKLTLFRGANTVDIEQRGTVNPKHSARLRPKGFDLGPTATLNLTSNVDYKKDAEARFKIKDGFVEPHFIGEIAPWATVEGRDWVTKEIKGSYAYFTPFENYFTVETSDFQWTMTRDVSLSGNTARLTENRTINSLRFHGAPGAAPALNLNGRKLTLNSGGVLSTGVDDRITGKGIISPTNGTRFYVHTYGDKLTIEEAQLLMANEDLIKTGSGTLILDADVTHRISRITINQGTIRLVAGQLTVAADKNITIGDGSGTDILELGPSLHNPIVANTPGAFPSIILHGNPFKPYTEGAILRLSGDTRQKLNTLDVRDHGRVHFANSTTVAPNILALDKLIFSDSRLVSTFASVNITGQIVEDFPLLIQGWNDKAAYLLVKKDWGGDNTRGNVRDLIDQGRIYFVGHGPAAFYRSHDLTGFDDYWQITPFPEPSTYGAILGAVGLGLVAWRRKVNKSKPACHKKIS